MRTLTGFPCFIPGEKRHLPMAESAATSSPFPPEPTISTLLTLQIFTLPNGLMELVVRPNNRVAVVLAADSPKLEDFSFFGDRLVTFGKLNLRLFVDTEEPAIAWLRRK